MKTIVCFSVLALTILTIPITATAASLIFSTGDVTSSIAMASRPGISGKIEIEAADDFVLTSETIVRSGTFTGLLTGGATTNDIGEILLEIYQVFPAKSDVTRTSGPPTFSTPKVPTRVNSPSDDAFTTVDTLGALSVSTTVLTPDFAAANSVLNGINPLPNQHTGGEGPVTGQEVRFTFTINGGLDLPADHYFFVPQVQIITSGGNFFWLSGTRPIVAPAGTPFTPDLQAWIRNANLDPDWLRVGTDIVGEGQTFNGAFSLVGDQVPEPSTLSLIALSILSIGCVGLLKKFRSTKRAE